MNYTLPDAAYAYVLMDNHVHTLLEVGDPPLAEFIRRPLGLLISLGFSLPLDGGGHNRG